MNKKSKELYRKIGIRLGIIVIAYFLIVFVSQFFINAIYREIAPGVLSEPIIVAKPFLDDFVVAYFSCSGNKTNVTFWVEDEYGNVRHNSSAQLNCDTFSKISLQGSPLDFTKDRRYIVYSAFNNQTINSGYFTFPKKTLMEQIKGEIYSFFSFMIHQDKIARGTYTDRQRLLFADTGDPKYAQSAVISHVIGLLYALVIMLGIDLAIWVFIWIRHTIKKEKS